MKKLLFLVLLLISVRLTGQKKADAGHLYYFKTAGNLLGVRNQSGKIILPAQKVSYLPEDGFDEPINETLLHLYTRSLQQEPHSIGSIYNREGRFLFAPFLNDNGPDWFSEGLMRIVKNGKMGFANRKGDIVIEPRYDYVSQFNYGIAFYCMGCVWETKGENAVIKGGTSGYINCSGDTLTIHNKKLSERDFSPGNDRFIPCQLSYSADEQEMIGFFNRHKEISQAYFVNHYSKLDSSERQLRFEIVERPSSFYPYYHIKAFECSNGSHFYGNDLLGLNFFADRKGRNFFVKDYDENNIPFNTWLRKYLKEAREYLKKNPLALYKF